MNYRPVMVAHGVKDSGETFCGITDRDGEFVVTQDVTKVTCGVCTKSMQPVIKKADEFTLLGIDYEDLRKDAEWFREASNEARENFLVGLQERIKAANLKAKQFRDLADHYERTANDIERFLAKDHSSLPKAMEA